MTLLQHRPRTGSRIRRFVTPVHLHDAIESYGVEVHPLVTRTNAYGQKHYAKRQFIPLAGGMWCTATYQMPSDASVSEGGAS